MNWSARDCSGNFWDFIMHHLPVRVFSGGGNFCQCGLEYPESKPRSKVELHGCLPALNSATTRFAEQGDNLAKKFHNGLNFTNPTRTNTGLVKNFADIFRFFFSPKKNCPLQLENVNLLKESSLLHRSRSPEGHHPR